MPAHPLVSVIVPNYNYRRYLPERLNSIFSQTYPNLEILFLDDASTDDSVTYVRSLQSPRPLRIIVNETNSGNAFRQWQRGINESKADYIWIAEADDSCRADLLEKLVAAALRHPTAGIVYTQSTAIDEQGHELGSLLENTDDLSPSRWREDYFSSGREEAANYLVHRNSIPNASACLFLKRALEDANLPGSHLRLCGDWLAYARICRNFDVAYVAEHSNRFRRHSSALRVAADRQGWGLREMIEVQAYIKDNFDVSHDVFEAVCQSNFRKFTHFIAHQTRESGFFENERIPELAAQFDPLFRLRMLTVDHQNNAFVEIFPAQEGATATKMVQRLGGFFSGGKSKHMIAYPVGAWTKIRVSSCRGPTQIRPLVRAGLVALRHLRMVDSVSGAMIWEATTADGYRGLELRGSAQRVGSVDALEIFAWDKEPIVALPQVDHDAPFELEFEIRAASLLDVLPDEINVGTV